MTRTPSALDDTRLEEVADGVHAHIQPDGGWCLNNAGVLVSGGHTALVDTAATEARARRLRELVGTVSPTAPELLVNTHFHGDHTFGNFVFAEAVVLGHRRTREQAAAAGLHLTGLWPDVDWGAIEVRPPSLTYTDRLTVHVGDLRAELLHFGPAHSTDDTVVWLPEPRVLFAGDIVMSGVTPFVQMGSVSGSLDTLARLRALDPLVVVPGHGPVGGPELIAANEDYLRWVRANARAGLAAGLTELDLARGLDLGEFAGLLDTERLVPNLRRAYAEENGAEPGAPLPVGELFEEMVAFHGGHPVCHA
ncbi:MBL fold metallo-hydrolase [Actinokineospora sp. NBRC 105648]|uniref:MBL fold metallo-hydrolase n=1 Tax=Actinokineospora sp. NBRC 105648 TaxID=3032206 RepID=UPI0024A4E1CF|nr:MBL fold metallo-hydrolase [Actinokineospora sp. NBRC 105648]GLZ38913.1 MBL fold metallo-hydrolase [Actinokineospora sp. NBRC 105648]